MQYKDFSTKLSCSKCTAALNRSSKKKEKERERDQTGLKWLNCREDNKMKSRLFTFLARPSLQHLTPELRALSQTAALKATLHHKGILYSAGALRNSYSLYYSHISRFFKPPNAADSNFTVSNVP